MHLSNKLSDFSGDAQPSGLGLGTGDVDPLVGAEVEHQMAPDHECLDGPNNRSTLPVRRNRNIFASCFVPPEEDMGEDEHFVHGGGQVVIQFARDLIVNAGCLVLCEESGSMAA